ncbi:hypothetical protein ABZ924_12160 [Streptomyces sp. NPDC046876]|uniref:hypothetical protein n=1 Tax=Streptomyces sp. NPDC046876 TaxID=3155616 RepID=UPI0033D88BB8
MGTSTMRTGLAAAASVLAALAAAAPVQAAPGGSAARCEPAVRVLERLPVLSEDPYPSPYVRRTQVNAIAEGSDVAVGMSTLKPAYWIGTKVFQPPLPAGSGSGTIKDVNRHGLMVGRVSTPDGTIGFSYRHGDPAITVLPGGGLPNSVNDQGVIVGDVWVPEQNRTVAMEWYEGRLLRELSAPPGYKLYGASHINNAGEVTGPAASLAAANGTPALFWPADRSVPARPLATVDGTEGTYRAGGLDDHGRIVGYKWVGEGPDHHQVSVVWKGPDTPPAYPPLTRGAVSGTLDGISPRTGVAVGMAAYPPEPAPGPYALAQYWTGHGPMRVLPGLTPTGYSVAFTATDDDRVGGTALDAGNRPQPVIWTCASQQAFVRR